MQSEPDNSQKKRSTSYIQLPKTQDFFQDRKNDKGFNITSTLTKGNSQTSNSCRNQMQQQISQNDFLIYRQQLKDNGKSKRISEIEQEKQNPERINREGQQGFKQKEERQYQQIVLQQNYNQGDEFNGNTKFKRATSYSLIDSASNNGNTTYQGIVSFGVEQQQQFLPTAFRNSIIKQQQQQQSQQKCQTNQGNEQGEYIRIQQQQYQEQQQQQQQSSQKAFARNQRNSLVIQRNEKSINQYDNHQILKTSYTPSNHKQIDEQQQYSRQINQIMSFEPQNKPSFMVSQQIQSNDSAHSTINIELQAINIELQNMNKKLSQRVNDLEIKTSTLQQQLSVSETEKLQAMTQFDILQVEIEVLQKELREIKKNNEQRGQQQYHKQEGDNKSRMSNHNGSNSRSIVFNTQSPSDVLKHYQSQDGQQDKNAYYQQYNSAPQQYQYSSEIKLLSNAQNQGKQQLSEDQHGKSDYSSVTTTVVSSKSSARSIKTGDCNSNHSNTNCKKQLNQVPSDSSLFEHTFSQEKMKKLEFYEEEEQQKDTGFNKAFDILYQIHVMFNNGSSNNIKRRTNSPSGEIQNTLEDLPRIIDQMIAENKQNMKFINSMKELMMKCAPEGYFESEQPSLKLIWKFIKKVMEEYSSLKTQAIQSGRKGRQDIEKKKEEEEEKQRQMEGNENIKNLMNNTDTAKVQMNNNVGSSHKLNQQQQQLQGQVAEDITKKSNYGKNKQILTVNNSCLSSQKEENSMVIVKNNWDSQISKHEKGGIIINGQKDIILDNENQLNHLNTKHNNLIDPIEQFDISQKNQSLQINQERQRNECAGTTSNKEIINKSRDKKGVAQITTTSACSKSASDEVKQLLSSPVGLHSAKIEQLYTCPSSQQVLQSIEKQQNKSQQPLSTEDAS